MVHSSPVIGALASRRSVRKYSTKDVPDNLIRKVLKTAIWAPSAHNAQPWRFIVIRDNEIKRELALAMARRFRKDLIRDGVPNTIVERRVGDSIKRITEAPVLILPCLTMEGMDAYPDRRRRKAEYVMAIQSVAASIENLLLALHVQGLGSCWLCAPLFSQPEVRRVLGMPSGVEPQALITVGWPDERPIPPPKLPLGEVVHWDRW